MNAGSMQLRHFKTGNGSTAPGETSGSWRPICAAGLHEAEWPLRSVEDVHAFSAERVADRGTNENVNPPAAALVSQRRVCRATRDSIALVRGKSPVLTSAGASAQQDSEDHDGAFQTVRLCVTPRGVASGAGSLGQPTYEPKILQNQLLGQ